MTNTSRYIVRKAVDYDHEGNKRYMFYIRDLKEDDVIRRVPFTSYPQVPEELLEYCRYLNEEHEAALEAAEILGLDKDSEDLVEILERPVLDHTDNLISELLAQYA